MSYTIVYLVINETAVFLSEHHCNNILGTRRCKRTICHKIGLEKKIQVFEVKIYNLRLL